MFENIVKFIRQLYGNNGTITLHEPRFIGNEKKHLADCIDTTYVSYVGEYVGRFEDAIRQFTGAKYAELQLGKFIDAI